MAKPILTQEYLKEILEYNPETGNLHWKKLNKTKRNIAGSMKKTGYWEITIGSYSYISHRIIWIYVNGSIDEKLVIDHINMNRSDNRISNLRLVTQKENLNNTRIKNIGSKLSRYLKESNNVL